MTMDAEQAGAILAEVDSIVAKVRQSRVYRLTGALLVLWGAIVIAADLIGFVWPRWSVWTWAAANALGAAASFAMLRAGPDVPRRVPWRFLVAFKWQDPAWSCFPRIHDARCRGIGVPSHYGGAASPPSPRSGGALNGWRANFCLGCRASRIH